MTIIIMYHEIYKTELANFAGLDILSFTCCVYSNKSPKISAGQTALVPLISVKSALCKTQWTPGNSEAARCG